MKGKSRRILALLVCITFPAALIAGCAAVQESPKTATGAAVGGLGGAALGAAIGAAAGRPGTGALIGGLTGILAGGLIGAYYDRQDRTRPATAQAYNYQPSQGALVRIERVEATPRTVYAGQSVNLGVTYAIIDPNPARMIRVTEIREIRQNGNIVGNPTANIERQGGTYTSTIPLTLPSDARPGTYTVVTKVQSENASDATSTSFTVASRGYR